MLGDAAAQQAQLEEDRDDDDFFDLADDDYGDEAQMDDMTYSKTADGIYPPRNNPFKTSMKQTKSTPVPTP